MDYIQYHVMKIKNIMITLIILMACILDEVCRKYDGLEIRSNFALKKEDLPQEFGGEALKTVNEFIGKTHGLNREWGYILIM